MRHGFHGGKTVLRVSTMLFKYSFLISKKSLTISITDNNLEYMEVIAVYYENYKKSHILR